MRDPRGVPTAVSGVVELPVGDMASLSTSGDIWGRWAAFAPRATASVGLPILLMIMLASAHPSTAMPLVPSMGAAGRVAASQ